MKRTIILSVLCFLAGMLCQYKPEVTVAADKAVPTSLTYDELTSISTSTGHVCYDLLYWYQSFPTVGLRLQEPFWPPPYPFIPHDYSLWELAPSKGEGVTVALLDNGVAGIQAENEQLPYHPDVQLHSDTVQPGFNFVDRHRKHNLNKLVVTEPCHLETDKSSLPIPQSGGRRTLQPSVLDHGTHTYSLLYGKARKEDKPADGLCGIAPESKGLALKVCDDTGIGRLSTLLKGVKKARKHNVDIINLSLSFHPSFDICSTYSKLLNELQHIPFVIIAAGNQSVFPHIFDSRYISVGSFGLHSRNVFIPSFSQYKYKQGPLFLAPGHTILGPLCDTHNPEYTFQHGTSLSAALMSGFFALMLGEFDGSFTKQEYETVCKASSFKMYDTFEWNEKSVYGTVDMRMALFMLHVLQQLRSKVNAVSFDTLVHVVRTHLLKDPYDYADAHNISVDFVHSFMDYFIMTQALKKKLKHKKVPKEHAIRNVVNDVIKKL